MKHDKLMDALGEIDEELVAEADAPVKKRTSPLVKWGSLAAAVVLVCGIGLFLPVLKGGGSSSAPEEEAAVAIEGDASAEDSVTSSYASAAAAEDASDAYEDGAAMSAASEALSEPPIPLILDTEPRLVSYEWSFDENGMQAADGSFLPEREELPTAAWPEDGSVTPVFPEGTEPDRISVTFYPDVEALYESGSAEGGIELETDGLTFTLPECDTLCLIDIFAEWTESGESACYQLAIRPNG